ncbi:unnamed protein product [Phytophthora fragariaefolia]|uniref:Unnamed protein product n=1 Tax=Phytophthora fragariaefolia TaxID=1490495 RepID=A0A9W7DDX4_9STRA|nr:unnamed protein product [Phytophthora fragariaefolia]
MADQVDMSSTCIDATAGGMPGRADQWRLTRTGNGANTGARRRFWNQLRMVADVESLHDLVGGCEWS